MRCLLIRHREFVLMRHHAMRRGGNRREGRELWPSYRRKWNMTVSLFMVMVLDLRPQISWRFLKEIWALPYQGPLTNRRNNSGVYSCMFYLRPPQHGSPEAPPSLVCCYACRLPALHLASFVARPSCLLPVARTARIGCSCLTSAIGSSPRGRM